MSEPSVHICCERHGSSHATFICQHLLDGYGVGFQHAYDPDDPDDPDDLRPDAWCDACDARLMAVGDWTDESDALAGVAMVCAGCYDAVRQRNERVVVFEEIGDDATPESLWLRYLDERATLEPSYFCISGEDVFPPVYTIWRATRDCTGQPAVDIHVATATCRDCPARPGCATRRRGRSLLIRRQEEFEALQAARQRQTTPEFRARYRTRAGVEGTHAQGTRRCGLRRTRFRGLAKTALGHTFIAAGLNLVRVAAWLAEAPRSATRRSAFARLAPAPG